MEYPLYDELATLAKTTKVTVDQDFLVKNSSKLTSEQAEQYYLLILHHSRLKYSDESAMPFHIRSFTKRSGVIIDTHQLDKRLRKILYLYVKRTLS